MRNHRPPAVEKLLLAVALLFVGSAGEVWVVEAGEIVCWRPLLERAL